MPGRTLAVVLALAGLVACAGTETGNPPAADGTRDVTVLPTEMWQGPPYFDSEAFADAERLGNAHMAFARVELLPEGTCEALESNPAAAVPSAIVLDLSEGMGFQLPAGVFCGLRLFPAIGAADDPTVPPLLVGHSLVFELRDLQGASYVRVRSQRTAPIVLFAGGSAGTVFEIPDGGAAAHLAVDAAAALIALRFWETPNRQADGSFLFEENNAGTFLRAFEAEPGLLRLFLDDVGSAVSDAGAPSADAGVGASSDGGVDAGTEPPDGGVDTGVDYDAYELARTR
ncbi:MAG: hypothetical protein H6726_20500 [Sandaracinaceae bacterium]|nr:hypothetical protein [Sandaracinaceae bacterium]